MSVKQEEKVLEVFKFNELYEENLEQMFLQATDCNLTVEFLNADLADLKDLKDKLVKTANDSITTLNKDLTKQIKVNEKQGKQINSLEKKKVFWRAIAVVEGVVITIITIIILT